MVVNSIELPERSVLIDIHCLDFDVQLTLNQCQRRYVPINSKFQHPLRATHGHLTVVRSSVPRRGRGGGKFEPYLRGMGNLNQMCQVFPVEYTWFIIKYEGA